MRYSKLSGVLVLGLAGAGCGGEAAETKPPVAPPPPPAETVAAPATTAPPAETTPAPAPEPKKSLAELQLATMKTVLDGWAAGDAKKVASAYSDSAKLVIAGLPEVTGRDAIQASTQKMLDGFSKVKVAPWRTFQKGDVLVVEWVTNATHTGEFLGLKGTEKPVGYHGVSLVWTTPEGQVKEEHQYFDFATIMGQVGATKGPSRPIPALPATSETHVAKGTPEEDKGIDALKAIYGAMESKKEADYLSLVVDNLEYEDFSSPMGSMKGKADAKKMFSVWTKAFPDAKSTVNHAWGVEDYVISEATTTGTHKGPLGPIAPTKKSINLKGVEIVQLKDGKLAKGWMYANGAEMLMQLGVIKAPAAAGAKADAKTDAKGGGKTDAPKADAKKTDAPKADAPKADAKKADAPKADAKKADAPKK